jgi:nucleoside-triphosphatase
LPRREAPRLLLEGRPGSGKTTLARRVVEELRAAGIRVSGFTTEEIRHGRTRVGFAIEAVSGLRATMAHVDLPGPPKVGRYGVDLDGFESIALPALRARTDVVVLDELGKMELGSEQFRKAVMALFDGDASIVATVHVFRTPFTDRLKRRSDVEVVHVTVANRDELPEQILGRIQGEA